MSDNPYDGLPFLVVDWVDSGMSSRWKYLDEFSDELPLARSVGWLVKESKDAIVLVSSIIVTDPESSVADIACLSMTIPKRAIVVRRKHNVPPRQQKRR